MISEHFFDSKQALTQALADRIAASLKASKQDVPMMLVSGGGTPKALFQHLSQRQDIAWENTAIGMVDERYLPEHHEDSNAKLIFDTLIRDAAEEASFMAYFDDEREAGQRAQALNVLMPEILDTAELAILGMGGDFHTASIFPDLPTTAALLDSGSDILFAANKPTTAPYDRVTLTMAGLERVPEWILHIEGAGKREIYESAKASDDYIKHPISAFLQHPSKTLHVFWAE